MLSFTVVYDSGPQPFWYQGPVSWKTIFPWKWWQGIVQAVMRAMGSDGERHMKLRSLTCRHLLLCGPVPNRPRTGRGPQPRDWGPLVYDTLMNNFVCKSLSASLKINLWERILWGARLQMFLMLLIGIAKLFCRQVVPIYIRIINWCLKVSENKIIFRWYCLP